MSQDIARYLEAFTEKARAAGLDMAKPGQNRMNSDTTQCLTAAVPRRH